MAALTKAEEAFATEFLFFEELTANDCESNILQDFNVSKTVRELNKAIAAHLGQSESWEQLRSIYANTMLDDLDRTLTSYNIVNGDTIYFVRSANQPLPPPYPGPDEPEQAPVILSSLFFRDLDGKTQTLNQVPLDSTVKDVISRYSEEKVTDVEWLRFLWGGKQIWPSNQQNDQRSLRDYGVGKESTIHVTARLRGGYAS
ncbi:hypothetical protein GQ53DRAFT_824541 [Thozetella sp. PMI_491]|nr:hypothetical protein GQ53DRAFT_824541 [Thozetella sp. PMI_491]